MFDNVVPMTNKDIPVVPWFPRDVEDFKHCIYLTVHFSGLRIVEDKR